jgi:phospholipase C
VPANRHSTVSLVAPVVYGIVEPYFQIATNYGYANWMFQTNQGPSFPAHQFLFTGTSAPTFPNNSTACYNAFGAASPCYQWFATELAYNVSDKNYGCIAQNGEVVLEAYPGAGSSNTTESPGWTPVWEPQPEPGYPCYDHNTMTDLLENNTQGAVSWRYYSDTSIGANPQGNLWTAPNAIEHICLPSGGNCTGPDWPGQTNYNGKITLKPPQILTDLGAVAGKPCNLQQVSWVIPDGSWSDHPGTVGADGGPSWVAAIVNAVGGYTNGGQKLPNQCTDTINGKQVPYWQDTVILVTWDDWGGFYDDVLPWNCSPTVNNGNCQGYSNSTGGQYVYGFRVPLLVVSAWTPQGYVSGSPSQAVQPYVHDFGSILNFTEWAFGKSQTSIGEISPNYHYADFLAPDAPFSDNNITQYSLSDFFVSFSNQPRPFTQIIGWKYDTSCFLNPKSCFADYPMDPDNDATDND